MCTGARTLLYAMDTCKLHTPVAYAQRLIAPRLHPRRAYWEQRPRTSSTCWSAGRTPASPRSWASTRHVAAHAVHAAHACRTISIPATSAVLLLTSSAYRQRQRPADWRPVHTLLGRLWNLLDVGCTALQVTQKNMGGGGEGARGAGRDGIMDLLVMENIFYGRATTRIYDLKVGRVDLPLPSASHLQTVADARHRPMDHQLRVLESVACGLVGLSQAQCCHAPHAQGSQHPQ